MVAGDGANNAEVFEAIAVKEIIIGTTATGTNAPLYVYGSSTGGPNTLELNTTNGFRARFNGSYYQIGSNGNVLDISGANGYTVFKNTGIEFMRIAAQKTIDMGDATDLTPPVTNSGAIFISGGALWFVGFLGTYTKLGSA